MFKGKQIEDGSIAEAKLATAYSAEVLKRDGSVALTAPLNAGSQRITNLAAPSAAGDAARLQDIQNVNRKELVLVASTANLTLSGEQTVNGVALSTGDRVLVKDQTTAADNGIYVVSTGAWSRAGDTDSPTEVNGAIVFVDGGTAGGNTNWQQVNTIATVGSDDQSWVEVGTGGVATSPTTGDKNLTALATSGDEDPALGSGISATPANDSYVQVMVNGIQVSVGNGAKTSACYFSADGGTTARSIANIASGDVLYWVGTVAGYELETTDRIDLNYNV